MSAVRARVSLAGPIIIFVLCGGCSDQSITGPLPNLEGMWFILRTVETDGCFLSDTTPLELTFRVRDGMLEIKSTSSPDSIPGLIGSIGSDGDFEVEDVLDASSFTETIRIRGSVTGDVLAALETHEVVFEDPAAIEIFGERCETVIRWEGERV